MKASSKSIAVLPFVNMSNDIDNEYFSDGITEEIINALSNIKALKVIARTSSFAFKGKQVDVREVGKELNVSTILEGSVRKVNNRVRISAQLIDTSDGAHYWSKNFDRELDDIFKLQDEISLLIADKIRENFGHFNVDDSLVTHHNISTESYHNYLRAKKLISRFNKVDVFKGISILKEIIEQHPTFALAHVNIHYAYNILAAGGLMPVKEAFEIGGNYLETAHNLKVDLPEVHHSLGWDALNKKWDFKAAACHLKKALELKPGYSDAHQKLFITLILEGNLEEANTHINTAYTLDPLNDLNNYFMGYNAYINKDENAVKRHFKRCFEINNKFIVGYGIYALALAYHKQPEHIIEVAQSIPEMEGSKMEQLIMTSLAHAVMQDKAKVEANISKLKPLLNSDSRERVRFFLIYIYTLLKQYNKALDLIDEGILHKEPLMTLVKVDPLLEPLRNLERFKNQLEIIFALSNESKPQTETTEKQLLSKTQIAHYKTAILDLMVNEESFLDTTLSLRTLADKIDIHPNHLSWLLNASFKKNFNDFINTYRLEYFKSIALKPEFKHITILGLAYDSGFNSKSVFNTFFKKTEGITPSKWVQKHSK
ncbi:helix-turn-helix domain-containing protein [Meridianimaribacter flavus]|uniref:AraC family transcriptional regulator n=1 Tax=Meridianimaribacter flavus TaxID=571115 RepID=A0ABY2G5F9_9FLAO|nr:helix-turn-helix domain-containing protein [Meridianimaribacter flavus]TDY11365.1 AraC family transcriptional regulator [Meridianimaribacter flavus]